MYQASEISRYITGVDAFPVTGAFPTPITLTGTYSTTGVVVNGTGTSLLREIVESDWLYSSDSIELRRIGWVSRDNIAQLERAFTSPATSEPVKICRPRYRSLMVTVSGATNVTINGNTYTPGEVISFNSDTGIQPIYYNATGSELTLDVTW